MHIDLFLWPFLLPLLIPIVFAVVYRKQSITVSVLIFLTGSLIVILYWPVVSSDFFGRFTYLFAKMFLFILLPVFILKFGLRQNFKDIGYAVGIRRSGLQKSVVYFLMFLPVMLISSVVAIYVSMSATQYVDVLSILSFFEAFTEEFFFRGVLFLMKR